jgi:protein-tyrosine-phosphatase
MNNILFICRHNRFRSKIAEAFFNKYNQNKNYMARSAGLLPGRYPLDKGQARVAKKFGIRLVGKPKPIEMDTLIKTDIVVVVADDFPYKILKNKKYGRKEIVWRIKDNFNGKEDEIYLTIKKIEDKVKKLLEKLK